MPNSNGSQFFAGILILLGFALFLVARRNPDREKMISLWASIATVLGFALALYLLVLQPPTGPGDLASTPSSPPTTVTFPTNTPLPFQAVSPTLALEELRTEAFRMAAQQHHVYINSQAGLYTRAQSENRGFARSNEFEFKLADEVYVAQVYMNGILYCKKGLWDDIRSASWDDLNDPVAKQVVSAASEQKLLTINLESAHLKHAQAYNLGYPVTSEFKFFDGRDWYTGQLFLIGLVYIKDGDIFGRHWTIP